MTDTYLKYETPATTFSKETVVSSETVSECKWKTFQRDQAPAAGGRAQYIDDVDSGGEASNV